MERSTTKANGATVRGQIGRETFDAVKALIVGGMKTTEAFRTVAQRTGRSAATVATAYYRVARTKPDGGGVKRRRASKAGRIARIGAASSDARSGARSRPAFATGGGGETAQLSRALVEAAEALALHVRRLEVENAEYRSIVDALDRLRR
jgi:hypothetical protein